MSTYKPITDTEFRVVHILPGKFADEVKCVLETRPSEVLTRYEALSYQWGDESMARRNVYIAHDYPPSPPILKARIKRSRLIPTAVFFSRLLKAAQQPVHRHRNLMEFVVSATIAAVLWVWLMPFLDSPAWTKYIMPRSLYLALTAVTGGYGSVKSFKKACWVFQEALKTKPWQLASGGHYLLVCTAEFGTTPVAPNLELALRHLRLQKKVRTMWIDALCINQQDEDEKKVQVQRMDFIYANAGAVIIWLGDCHGIAEGPPCHGQPEALSYSCKHESKMSDAFTYVWAVSGWRLLVPTVLLLRQDTNQLFQRGSPGLIAVAQRGWWRRLWVLQEATLGTAKVLMQCGQYTCEFEHFQSCQAGVLQQNPEPRLRDALQSSKRFVSLFQDFRYTKWNQTAAKKDLTSAIARGLLAVIKRVILALPNSTEENTGFDRPGDQKKCPADRLLHILMRTAGHFECRDDRDRLYAVLGVVGGVAQGRNSMAGFMEFIGSFQTQMIICNGLGDYLKAKYPDMVLTGVLAGLVIGMWPILYDSHARYWTISRPEYVMTRFNEVIQALEGKTGPSSSRGDFFGALAQYIGKETESLAFLDACSPEADEDDDDMPSWAPTWTKNVEDAVYQFAGRGGKDGHSLDSFRFFGSGKTLELSGLIHGIVSEVKMVELHDQTPLSWVRLLEELWMFIPDQAETLLVQLFEKLCGMNIATLSTALPVFLDAENVLRDAIPTWARRLLEDHGNTVVQCQKNGEETAGFLKAGAAKKDDVIVFVPGCCHQLVLRRRTGQGWDNMLRWKLVGLVFMKDMIDGGREKGGFSRSEWDKLRKERQLRRFKVV